VTGSQPPAQFPGLPASPTSTGGFDSGSRTVNSGNTPASQPTWPSVAPAGTGTGMNMPNPPPVNTSPSGDSSYQTRYPQLQSAPPAPAVPTMPKPGSNPNE
jgi:hypothetical protein